MPNSLSQIAHCDSGLTGGEGARNSSNGELVASAAETPTPLGGAGAPASLGHKPVPPRHAVERCVQLATAQRATPGSAYPPSVAKGTNASLSLALSTSRSSSGSPRSTIANGPATSMTHCS
jgi:hypothetical protein